MWSLVINKEQHVHKKKKTISFSLQAHLHTMLSSGRVYKITGMCSGTAKDPLRINSRMLLPGAGAVKCLPKLETQHKSLLSEPWNRALKQFGRCQAAAIAPSLQGSPQQGCGWSSAKEPWILSLCPTLAGTNCLVTLPGVRIFGQRWGVPGLGTPTVPGTFNLRANFLNTTLPGWSFPQREGDTWNLWTCWYIKNSSCYLYPVGRAMFIHIYTFPIFL